jgi:hypothetical protein
MALLSDFRHAVTVLRKAPLFSLTSILSLAIGIAASTAIFSLADAMVFRPRVGITSSPSASLISAAACGRRVRQLRLSAFAPRRSRRAATREIAVACARATRSRCAILRRRRAGAIEQERLALALGLGWSCRAS